MRLEESNSTPQTTLVARSISKQLVKEKLKTNVNWWR
jgi:hypothetical protein